MNIDRIAALLAPYLEGEALTSTQLSQISTYIDLLLKWNARMNLTAVRDPEEIVTRHFGESLFTGHYLFPDANAASTLVDVGSGAGFPGLPIAIARPNVKVTLIEAHGKKATFLKEVLRGIGTRNVLVFPGRAESYGQKADVVTFRAVERFEAVLPVAGSIVKPGGRLAALIGSPQATLANELIGVGWGSGASVYFPGSTQSALWVATRIGEQ